MKCKDQPKLFYKLINGKLKSKDEISIVKAGEETVDDPKEVPEVFNRYFHSVFTKENYFRDERTALEKGTDLKEIKTLIEVKNMLEDLDVRKAMSPDGVLSWILKECSSQLVSALHNIISTTLVKGRVPIDWKWADITSIHKTGSKEDPLNYRPVLLTSVVAKICEKIIMNRWVKYLEDNKVITEKQFGFRKGRSCVTNLISFYSRVIDIVQEREMGGLTAYT